MKQQIILNGISHLQHTLKDSKKVLLVCDNSFPYLNIKDDIENINVPHVHFSEFKSNPLYEDVCKGVDLFNATMCDTILAVGGGSSLDVAKCIKLFCRMSKDKLYLEQDTNDTGVKLIAIPTTAGTGSESTRYAVIYYNGKKQSITHDSIIPNIAILEPKVLKSLPLYQKKCTMLDALCQGIESWWSVNSTNESKQYSKLAVEIITKWWHEYIFENTDDSARQIMQAANYAGRAISITQTTAPHAFSYKITSLYTLPHGHAVAICLPEIWNYMINHPSLCVDSRGIDYLKSIFSDIAHSLNSASPELAIETFYKMISKMEITYPRAENKEKDIQELSDSVNPIRLKNNPIVLNNNVISSLYKAIIK